MSDVGSGGRAAYGTGAEPGGAGGGYIHRSVEDVHGYLAEYELVAAVSAGGWWCQSA